MKKAIIAALTGLFLFATAAKAHEHPENTVGHYAAVWAVCADVVALDAFHELVIVPGNDALYLSLMQDPEFPCYDGRVMGIDGPVTVRLYEYVKTLPWAGNTAEIWWVMDATGAKAITWVFKAPVKKLSA
jgi:hypothetical protein